MRPSIWIGLFALAIAGLTAGIASTPLMDPDEGRNAEVAREMAEQGDFVVPHLDGLPYLDKPVLFFALAAISIDGLGATEAAARLPALLSTLATLALVIAFGWHVFDRRTGALAGLAMATSPLVIAFARIVIFDSALMLFVSAALFAFYMAWARSRSIWWIAGWAAIGAGALTKGPVALALPIAVNLAYAWCCGERARRIFHPVGLMTFAVIVAPWFFAVTARHPEFPHYAFVRETLERTTTDRMNRTGPIYYFLPLLIGGALPWILLPLSSLRSVLHSIRERRATPRPHLYLWLWIGLPLVLFSLSQSKRPGYILPLMPAVALVSAHALLAWPHARRRAVAVYAGALVLGALVAVFGAAAIASRVPLDALAAAIRAAGPLLGAILAAVALLSLAALRGRRPLALITTMAVAPALIVLSAQGVLHAVGENRSARSLAEAIRKATPSTTRVVAVGVYPASLSYYLGRRIPIATDRGSVLKSNYIAEYAAQLRTHPNTPLRPADWWRQELRQCNTPTVFVIKASREDHRAPLAATLPLLAAGPRYAAYGPCQTGDS
jgi:4-amino-4-deoxy-L-arabinose transferase-like glycosyltransferase